MKCDTCGKDYDPTVKNESAEHERALCGHWECNGDRRCYVSRNRDCHVHGE